MDGNAYEAQVRQLFLCANASFVDLDAVVWNSNTIGVSTLSLGGRKGTEMHNALYTHHVPSHITFAASDRDRVDEWAHRVADAEADLIMVHHTPLLLDRVVENIEALAEVRGGARFYCYDGRDAFVDISARELFAADCRMVVAEICRPMQHLPLKVLQLERDLTVLRQASTAPRVFEGDTTAADSVAKATGTTSLLWFGGPGNDAAALKELGQALGRIASAGKTWDVMRTRLVAVYMPFVPVVCGMATRKQQRALKQELLQEQGALKQELLQEQGTLKQELLQEQGALKQELLQEIRAMKWLLYIVVLFLYVSQFTVFFYLQPSMKRSAEL